MDDSGRGAPLTRRRLGALIVFKHLEQDFHSLRKNSLDEGDGIHRLRKKLLKRRKLFPQRLKPR